MVIKDDAAVGEAAASLCAELRAAGHRVRLDDRTDTSFGRRSVDWELKGVPVRVEVGPRDLAEGNVTLVVRHRREKKSVPLAGVGAEVDAALASAEPGPAGRGDRLPGGPTTADAATLDETVEAGSVGFARVRLGALGPDGEDRLAQHALTVRCLQRPDGSLAGVGDAEADLFAIVGRSY